MQSTLTVRYPASLIIHEIKSLFVDQKGISKRFVDYFHSLDETVGHKAIGHDQTVSSKLQEQYQHAADKARAFDEQRGITKSAHDVSFSPFTKYTILISNSLSYLSITRKLSLLPSVRGSRISTQILPSRSRISMRKRGVFRIRTRLSGLVHPHHHPPLRNQTTQLNRSPRPRKSSSNVINVRFRMFSIQHKPGK